MVRCWGAYWGDRDLDEENTLVGGLVRLSYSATGPVGRPDHHTAKGPQVRHHTTNVCGPAKKTVTVVLSVQENLYMLWWVAWAFVWGWWLARWGWRKLEEMSKANKAGLGGAIGGTPLVRLRRLEPKSGAQVWAKLEFCSPGGSVKDRIAWAMIEAAEERGEIAPGKTTIVEATSGNTGVGVAMVCAAKGYRCVLTMPRAPTMTERYMLCRAHGAEICLSDPSEGAAGFVRLAEEIASSTPDSYLLRQFENDANWRAHEETTAPEIWEQSKGRVTHLVAGCGTAGTLLGCSTYLKRYRPSLKICCVEAAESRVVAGLDTQKPVSHGLLGISSGFYPPLLPRDDPSLARLIDHYAAVPSSVGAAYAKKLAQTEGLLVGPSSGAACKAALDLAATLSPDHFLVVIFPSSGARYLQHPFFGRIREEAEKKLPNCVFCSPENWR